MAYSNIPDTEIAVGKPGSNQLFTKLRDNPEAIALGLAGATRIVKNALSSDSVDFANKIDDSKSSGTLDCSAGASPIVPKGVCNLNCSVGSARLEVFANGGWHFVRTLSASAQQGWQIISDGASVRVGGFAGTNTVLYYRIFQ